MESRALQPIEYDAQLSLSRVSLRRGTSLLLSNVDLTLSSGSLLYVTGQNGIGKTSLLLAIAGFLRPETGSIKSDKVAIMQTPDGASKGLTSREDLKFHLCLSRQDHRLSDLLKSVGLEGASNVKTEDLSLGQRKRLCLAKIIASQAPIWLLDEPFSALDENGQDFVETTIAQHLTQGGLCIIATHLPRQIRGHKSQTLHLSKPETC